MSRFQPVLRNTDFLFSPSINDWLPEVHWARFVVEIVDQLDLKEMERVYKGTGEHAVSSRTSAVHPDRWLCDRRILQPQSRSRHL